MSNTELFFLIFNLNGQNEILDKLMIFGSTELIYLTFAAIIVLGIKGGIKEKKTFLLIILGLPIAVLLIKIIHLFIFVDRPFVNFDFKPIVPEGINASFPSRHATISAVIAFAYMYLKSKWYLLFLPIMIWIGMGRIYIGVHYPLDIIGGFALGLIIVFLAILLKRLIFFQISRSL